MSIELILVPDDFSEHSGYALDHAIGLAVRFGSRIELAHAFGAPAATLSPYGTRFPVDLLDGVRDAATAKLEESAERVRAAGIEVTTRLSKRTPDDALPKIAADSGSDMIVMGTRGYGGIKQALLGSVAQALVRSAPCPVLTVSRAREGSGPLHFARVLLPTDFSTACEPARDAACELAGRREDGAEIVLAHAVFVHRAVQSYLDQSNDPSAGEFSKPLLEKLDAVVSDLASDGYSARSELLPGQPEAAVVDLAAKISADLIVMGTHGRSGLSHLLLGSVAEHVLRTAECPTLTVKTRDE